MFHTVTAVSPRPIASPIALATGPEMTRPIGDQPRQDDRRQGDDDHQRAQLPERPALADLVDPVHRPAEGAHVPGRGPQRTSQADDQREPGGLVLRQLSSGARMVSATEPAPMSESTVISSSVLPCWPKRPSSETSASSAGNNDSTA